MTGAGLSIIGRKLATLRWQLLAALILRGTSAVFSFALSWLIARAFGAEGLGNFSVALTTATLAGTIALTGLDYVIVRVIAVETSVGRYEIARDAIRRTVSRTMFLSVAFALIIALGRNYIATDIIGQPSLAPFLGIMALAIPVLALARLCSCIFRGLGEVIRAQIVDGPAGTGLAAVALGVTLLSGATLLAESVAYYYLVSWTIVILASGTILARRVSQWPANGKFRESLALVGLPVLCVAVSNLFIDWFATLMLSAWASSAEAGLFRVAFQIAAVLNLIVAATDSILSPVIASSYHAGDRVRVAQVASKAALATAIISSPLIAAMLLYPELLMNLFGASFVSGADALRVLAVAQLTNILLGPVGTILIMTKHERWSMVYGVGGAILAAVLIIWLVPLYGALGAAYAVAAATIARRLAAFFIVQRVVGIHFIRDGIRTLKR